MTPFELVYGVGSVLSLPLELSVCKLQTTIKDQEFHNALEKRIMYLAKIEEQHDEMVDKITMHQDKVKNIFYKKSKPRKFMIRDKVLLWDKCREPKGAHNNFDPL